MGEAYGRGRPDPEGDRILRHVVIGVPVRDEGSTIVALADALERGTALLGEVATAEIVLAYQDSEDDTLERFVGRRSRVPQQVLRCPPNTTGKGRNVKLLIEHARAEKADLLLVDGDMREYAPTDLARFVAAAYDNDSDQVLPIWCRQWGHGNATNFLAVPALRALFGAQVRQPLAGQRFVSRGAVSELDVDALPDDYGIDVSLTMAALDGGGRIDQVHMPHVDHDVRQVNSEVIMCEVAAALLARVGRGPAEDRSDVVVPDRYASRLVWPHRVEAELDPPRQHEVARDAWLDALAAALRAASVGAEREQASALVAPFFEHADARRADARPPVTVAEDYVWALGDDLARRLA
jgi:CTP:molybdopterin cytidylyltransferase MocA